MIWFFPSSSFLLTPKQTFVLVIEVYSFKRVYNFDVNEICKLDEIDPTPIYQSITFNFVDLDYKIVYCIVASNK